MRVVALTAMYPTPPNPSQGTFVKEHVDSLRAAGAVVEVLHFDGGQSLLSYLKAGFKLRKLLKERDFDIVHAHYGLTGIPALMQRKCPVVITYHGSDLLGEVNRSGHYTIFGRIKALVGKVCGLFAQGKTVVAPILAKHTWGSTPTVIPMGVDLSKFKPLDRSHCRSQLGLPSDKPLLLFLANPENGVKRFDIASAAVDLARTSIPDLELLPVFGIDHAQIPLYLNACDALILTSNHEASPCVIKESLACNLPIIAVDVGDVAERMDGVEGCFLCEQSSPALAEGIRSVFHFGRRTNGRLKVEEISLENTARKTMTLFQKVVSD
jgi:glycosyltransferase involved in cell wall biosynthesis